MMNVKEAYGCVRDGNISTAPNIWDRAVCSRKCEVSITWYGYSAVRRSLLYTLRMWFSYCPCDWHCTMPVGPWLSVNGWSWALVGAFLLRGCVCFENAKSVASAARGSSTGTLRLTHCSQNGQEPQAPWGPLCHHSHLPYRRSFRIILQSGKEGEEDDWSTSRLYLYSTTGATDLISSDLSWSGFGDVWQLWGKWLQLVTVIHLRVIVRATGFPRRGRKLLWSIWFWPFGRKWWWLSLPYWHPWNEDADRWRYCGCHRTFCKWQREAKREASPSNFLQQSFTNYSSVHQREHLHSSEGRATRLRCRLQTRTTCASKCIK